MRLFRRAASTMLFATALSGPGLLAASGAQAISFYAEILTSTAFPLFPDVQASATLAVDFDPLTFDWTGMTSSPGLGAPLISFGGPAKEYTHTFDPTPDAASVLDAWLVVSVSDDQLLDPGETASIALDGSLWQTGQATFNLFLGSIHALGLITLDDASFEVSVASTQGDFYLLASALKVKFAEVPEPGAGLLAGLGLVALAGWARGARPPS